MIYPPAKALLETFSKESTLASHKACLIGGTAIAYHTGHRVSFDLDICFPHHSTLPPLDFLENYHAKPLPFDKTIVDTMTNEGGVMEEFFYRWCQS